MKRILMILMAAFLMGGMVMAQHARRGDKMPDPKARAERMTERMAKEYSLDDTQKQQLLEANLAFVAKMGDKPMHRTQKMREERKACDSCACKKESQNCKKESEVAGKTNRTDYDAQLQKILTKEQYAAYTKNLQDRKDKREFRNKDLRKKDTKKKV